MRRGNFRRTAGRGGVAGILVTPATIFGSSLSWFLTADTGYDGTTWTDQSGTGDSNKDAVGVGTEKPALNTSNSNFNGQRTLDWDGTNDRMVTGTWSSGPSQPFTTFVVARIASQPGGANTYLLAGLTDPPMAATYGDQPSLLVRINAGANVVGGAYTTAAFVVVSVFNGASSKIFVSARTPVTGDAGAQNPAGFTLGDYPTTNALFRLNGSIAQCGLVTGAITDAKAAEYLAYAGSKYAIAIGA